MAIAAIPQNFILQSGNAQVYLSWDNVAGATSYTIQRSLDGVTYSNYASVAVNSYVDPATTVGTEYFYQIASTNLSGNSGYTSPQSIVPSPPGEITLGEIRLQSKQRADRVNSQFLTTSEWNNNINQSMYELYDLLITCYEDYFIAPPVTLTTDGTTVQYPLPNGYSNFITNSQAAPAFYKLSGVDLSLNTSANAYVTVDKFDWIRRNEYVFPNTASTIYGVFNMRYRLMGSTLYFTPTPSAGQGIRIWYIPRLPTLLKDKDTTTVDISGWIEYVIVDAAIKALQKEESDVSVLMAQKMALKARIEESAMNRDAGRADTISNSRSSSGYYGSGFNGPVGGF